MINACTGAVKPSSAADPGMSWTRPSVMMTAPATRSGGTSASVEPSAENSRVPHNALHDARALRDFVLGWEDQHPTGLRHGHARIRS